MNQKRTSVTLFTEEIKKQYPNSTHEIGEVKGSISDFKEQVTNYFGEGGELVARYHHRHKFGVVFD